MSVMQLPNVSQSLPVTGGLSTTCLSTSGLPLLNASTMSGTTLPTQPQLDFNTVPIISQPLTNQMTVNHSSPMLNSSFSSAPGLSPLRPVSPVYSLSPVAPTGLGVPAIQPRQLATLPTFNQLQSISGGSFTSAAPLTMSTMAHPSLPPPFLQPRRVLLQPSTSSLHTLGTPSLGTPSLGTPLQRPAIAIQQPFTQAVPMQSSIQPYAIVLQPQLVQPQPQLTHLTTPQPPPLIQARPLQPMSMTGQQQYLLQSLPMTPQQVLTAPQPPPLIQARPLQMTGQQQYLLQSLPMTPQQIQLTHSPQILTVSPSLQPPGTMLLTNTGIL